MMKPMENVTYQVTGLHCGACVNRVKSALTNSANEVEVTLTPPRATLSNPKQDLAALNELLAHVGDYRLSPLDDVLDHDPVANTSNISWLSKAKQWLT